MGKISMLVTVLGGIATTILACKATYDAHDILADESLTWQEKAKQAAPHYVKVLAANGAVAACAVADDAVTTRKIKNLVGTVAAQSELGRIAQEKFNEYDRVVREQIGPKKGQALLDEAIGRMMKNKAQVEPAENEMVFYDIISKQKFAKDIEVVRRAERDLMSYLTKHPFVSLNYFYEMIGLDKTDIGYQLGWNNDDGVIFEYTSMLDDDGKPCIVLGYKVAPKYRFGE